MTPPQHESRRSARNEAELGAAMRDEPLVRFDGVSVRYGHRTDEAAAVRRVDLALEAGVAYGLVGESGSGKSTLALALLRALPPQARVVEGRVLFHGDDLASWSRERLRKELYGRVAYVPQDPLASLNPSLTVAEQVVEALAPDMRAAARRRDHDERVLERLEAVGLADPKRVASAYPHQLSGGMQQRVLIAMALTREPELLVLDEPTTSLDVTTEATILDLVRELVKDKDTAVLWVSHSLGVVASLCERVAVMYAGEVVEDGAVTELYGEPLHPYTRGLFDSVPRVGSHRHQVSLRPIQGRVPRLAARPTAACVFAPRCPLAIDACRSAHPPLELVRAGAGARRVRCIRWRGIAAGELDPRQTAPPPPEPAPMSRGEALAARDLHKRYALPRGLLDLLKGAPGEQVHAVNGVSFDLGVGRTLGLVGESGSGKSTTARLLLGLEPASGGTVRLRGRPLPPRLRQRSLEDVRALQMVFQSSSEALNPYRSVGASLARPLRRLGGVSRSELDARVAAVLEAVQLTADYAQRVPGELSGGERQRVAIARAFVGKPDVLVLDESVSGLDVSVQAAVVNLLSRLQGERSTAYLFISHDLAVVSYLADELAVMYLGAFMERGPAARVLAPPYHPYTEALLGSVPLIDPGARGGGVRLSGEVPSAIEPPSGCPFHTRCPRLLGDICRTTPPPWREGADGHGVYCHIPLDELEAIQRPAYAFSHPASGAAGQDGGREDA